MPFTIRPSRRAFLSGLAAGGAALAAGRSPFARGEGAAETPWLALISDVHIDADPAKVACDQNMAENLRVAVADILAQGSMPRGVVIDGDLAFLKGLAADYRMLLERLEPIRRARVPLHLALGNHDARETFRAAFHAEKPPADTLVEDHHVGVVEAAGLRLILLDSLIRPNSTPGSLGDAQRGWLAKALDAETTKPTLVFVHHNPAVGNAGALQDAQELLDLLAPRRQVKALIFGHTHVWDVSNRDGLYLINLPAVAYPFNASQPLGWCRLTPNDGGATLELRPLGAKEFRDRHDLRWRAS